MASATTEQIANSPNISRKTPIPVPPQFGGTGSSQPATGTGSVVLSNNPVLVTPNLGTPSTVILTHGTGLVPSSGLAASGTPSSTTFLRGDNSWTAAPTPPGGSNTQLQYNNSGSFAGITGATTDGIKVTLTAPILGTPTSGTLTTCTGLPISTGVSGLGTGVATLLSGTSSGTGGPAGTTSPVFTGTVTFPDSSSWTSTGLTLFNGGTAASQNKYLIINGSSGASSSVGIQLRENGSTVAQWYHDQSSNNTVLASTSKDPAVGIAATTGNLRFYAYGAGTLVTDASGNVTASSDETLKTDFEPFTRSIDALRGTTPKIYRYTKESGLDTSNRYAGYVITDDFEKALPESVFTNEDKPRSLWDRAILATIHNVVLEQQDRINSLENRITELEKRLTQGAYNS